MLELKGKYNSAKVFTDVIGESAVAQIIELCCQPMSEGAQIRIMPYGVQDNGRHREQHRRYR